MEMSCYVVASATLVIGILLIVAGLVKKTRSALIIIGLVFLVATLALAIIQSKIPYMSSSQYLRVEDTESMTKIEPWYHDDGTFTTVKADNKHRLLHLSSRQVELNADNTNCYMVTTMSRQYYGLNLFGGKIILTAKTPYTTTTIDLYLPQNILPQP